MKGVREMQSLIETVHPISRIIGGCVEASQEYSEDSQEYREDSQD